MSKKTQRIELQQVIDGIVYTGYTVVEGTKELFQIVHFNGLFRSDDRSYKPSEWHLVEHFANVLFKELINESLSKHSI